MKTKMLPLIYSGDYLCYEKNIGKESASRDKWNKPRSGTAVSRLVNSAC